MAARKGELCSKISSSYSQASVGKIILAKTRSRYDNGKLLFLKECASGRRAIARLFDVIGDKRIH